MLGRHAAAEDAAQEALLRGWLKQGSCRDADRPLPWLSRIARNEALRARAREARRDESPIDADLPAAGGGGADALDAAAGQVDAQRLLDALPPVDRELMRLHYLEDLTQAEAAARLELSWVTAKVRLHRARLRLRALVEDGQSARQRWP